MTRATKIKGAIFGALLVWQIANLPVWIGNAIANRMMQEGTR